MLMRYLSRTLTTVCILLLLLALAEVSIAKTLYVDDDGGPGVFTKIQDAVETASAGDVIIVRGGNYTENVKVNKSLTIRSEEGEGEVAVVHAACPYDHALEIVSNSVNISGLTVKDAKEEAAGIYLRHADECNVSSNDVSSCTYGIFLSNSSKCIIARNTLTANGYYGIFLELSSDNVVENNTAANNWDGFLLILSHGNAFKSNTAANNNFGGITLMDSSQNFIAGNTAETNYFHGFYLLRSSNNTLKRNTASLNMMYGLHVLHSNGNEIYLNNFVMNRYNVRSSRSTNVWDTSEKISYVYNSETYENYMGNHWGDFEGEDTDGDGIGDVPYYIDSDKDENPLMEPFESYELQEQEMVFDTGTPANPYPSISGTHNGTIKLNQKITVSKLYTYSCPGTGGHTEYVRIWVDEIDVNATWNGYHGDWHNISFDEAFTLESGKTYNYTIYTGSYPQIHHIDNLSTSAGIITCSEFIDANGKKYNNMIPAFRLFL